MRAPLLAALALLLLPGAAALPAVASPPAGATIRYSVSVADRAHHRFVVTMTVPEVHGRLIVAMPAWNALYQIRDFASRVSDVRAVLLPPAGSLSRDRHSCLSCSAGLPVAVSSQAGLPAEASAQAGAPQPLAVEAIDKQTWRIAAEGTVRLTYDVFWNDPPPFGSQLDSHHAFLNLAEILFYLPDRRGEAAEVEFTGVKPGWKIAVELPAGAAPDSFRAPGYDALVDAPVEIGDFDQFRLTVNGARLRVIVDGKADENMLAKSIRTIVGYETALMGEVPFDEYLFLYHFGEDEGGMEHANSAAIALTDQSEAPAVTAHEFFHVWNVKRIRPRSLEPIDYAREQWTRALWFAEGVTSTYAAYTLVRTGVWSREEYRQHLADLIAAVESRPARAWQSVEEASLDAWLEKYPWYFRPDRSISYYDKGELLGLLLDIRIRDLTDNRKSLDDLMRELNRDYAHRHRFYHGSAAIEQAAEALTGHSFAEFFARYVSGAAQIPYESLFRRAGLRLRLSSAPRASLGLLAATTLTGAIVVRVLPGSAAEKAGVREGDLIVKLDGKPFPYPLRGWLDRHKPGETVTLLVRRDGAALGFSYPLESRSVTVYAVEEDPKAGAAERRIREGLFAGKTD